MKTKFFLTVNSRGKGLKITKGGARVNYDEICFPMELEIPDVYFRRAQLTAKVSFPEKDLPPVMTDAQIHGIEQIIKEQTGLSLTIKVENDEEIKHQGDNSPINLRISD